MTFGEWLTYGIRQGWVSDPWCCTHDGAPLTDNEADNVFDDDMCVPCVRIYGDDK